MSAWLRAIGVALAMSLASPPALARVEPSGDLEAAQRLHREGQDRYDTADYQGAVERWTKAYGALPNTPQAAAMKPFVLYNIASAHQKAYEIYGDVAQLRKARTLLVKFEATIDKIYEDPAEAQAERERVQQRLAEIDAQIAAHDEADVEPPPTTTVVEPPPQPTTAPNDAPISEPVDDDASGAPPDARLISGAVLVGLGAGASAVMLAGVGLGARANDISGLPETDFDGREQQFDRGRRANTLAIAGAIAAPLLLGAGITLIVLAKRKPRSSAHAHRRLPVHASPGGIAVRF